jgi:hypothetical protein
MQPSMQEGHGDRRKTRKGRKKNKNKKRTEEE